MIPVLTDDATRFVGEVTFSALASEPAQRSLWNESSPIPHTMLGQSADLVVVAPATAHTLARVCRRGLSDDLLTATLLATRAPVLVCPAMHTEMWEHPSVRDNLATLERRGVRDRATRRPAVSRAVIPAKDVWPNRPRSSSEVLALLSEASPPCGRAGETSELRADLIGLQVVVSAGGTGSPSTRSATSRIAPPESKATHSRQRRRAAGPQVTLVTASPLDAPSRCRGSSTPRRRRHRRRHGAGHGRERGRRRHHRHGGGRRRLSGRRPRRPPNSPRKMASPRSSWNRPPTSSPGSRRVAGPARSS